jgi:cysteinyl-tRNA synthetase
MFSGEPWNIFYLIHSVVRRAYQGYRVSIGGMGSASRTILGVVVIAIIAVGAFIYLNRPKPVIQNQSNSTDFVDITNTTDPIETDTNSTDIEPAKTTSIEPENATDETPVIETAVEEKGPIWGDVDDYLYILQNIDLEEIGETEFDLVIIDYSLEGDDESRFTFEEIACLKNSTGGKLVLAYMSIGEAETYRWYWERNWDRNGDGRPDPGAPGWLGSSNPEWPENYKVRYWESEWKMVVYDYLDRLVEAGFDGVYLDIIDAYEYWGPWGESGLNRSTAERDMVEFVLEIAEYARETSNNTGFGVFPQNGEALSVHPDYLDAVTGIGKEDTWYDGDDCQPGNYTEETIVHLDRFRDAGKLVLVIDYPKDPGSVRDFYLNALEHGYVPYVSNRDLDLVNVVEGFEPD